jgi:hypothetical protein
LPAPLGDIAAMTSERRLSRARRKPAGSGRRRGDDRTAAARSHGSRPAPGEVVVGTFAGVSELGEPLVDHPLNPEAAPVPARSTVPLARADLGRQVVLAFESGDVRRPIVMGAVWRPNEPAAVASPVPAPPDRRPVDVERDGDQLVLSADREIVIRCGEASITLTRAGKVLIRGTYLLSRSSGVNRIKGGSVQLN